MTHNSLDLIRIPLKDVFTEKDPEVDLVKVIGLSSRYKEDDNGLNIIPITVVAERGGNYRLIKGHEIFYSLLQAGKEWALALRIPDDLSIINQCHSELNLSAMQLNICDLNSKQFESVLEYLQRGNKKLAKINLEKLVKEFANDPTRSFWSDLNILTEAKCGITKTNLPLISTFLYASPDLSKLEPISRIEINRSSEEDIVNQLQRLKIEPGTEKLRKIDSISTARAIIAEKDRIYWSSGKHLTKARTGISPMLWPLIEPGFYFDPIPTPVPNNSRFLLSQLNVRELREEAKQRNLESKGLLKSALIDLLAD